MLQTRPGWPTALASLLCSLCLGGFVLAVSPSLEAITPPGGQRGTEFDLLFSGAHLKDAQEVLSYSPGIQAVRLEVVDGNQVKVRLKVAPDCPLGPHALRLRTATGISELRTISIGALPSVQEQEPNNDRTKAQKVALNVTVMGVIENGDVDCFQVEVRKGQRLAVEVEGIRLGNTFFDPHISVLDSSGKELSAADDTALLRQDAFLTLLAPADGVYTVQVRETNFGGSESCSYRLHIGSFPRPALVYPPGGQAGETVTVRFLGDAGGEFAQKVQLPAQPQESFGVFAEQDGQTAPSPNPFRVSAGPNVLEVEPNDDRDRATVATVATGGWPLACNGILGTPGDVDWFRFTAKKGDVMDVQALACKLGSPLDPVLKLYQADGAFLGSSDDADDHDSYLRFTAPADGEYLIQVSDKRGQGGPGYVYRVELNAVRPALSLFLPRVERQSQERQTVVVPRGNRYATFLAVSRSDFDGPVAIEAKDLPPGLTLHADPIEAGRYFVPVVFEAAAAPVGGKLVELTGRSAGPGPRLTGGFRQVVDLVAGPADAIYHKVEVEKLAVAVAEEVPFKVHLAEPKVPLVQDGLLSLKVTVERKPGFTAPVVLTLPFLPPWVEAPEKVVVRESETEAVYPLKALPETEVRSWKLIAQGQAEVGNGRAWVSSSFITLRIAPPLVRGQIEPAAGEQGKTTKVVVKLEPGEPFDGKAKAQLLNLPPRVTAADVEITKDTREIAFTVTIDKTSPVGLHKGVYCQVTISKDEQQVTHSVGRGMLLVESEGGTLKDKAGRPLDRLEILRRAKDKPPK